MPTATEVQASRTTFAPQMGAQPPMSKQRGPNIGYTRPEIEHLRRKAMKIDDCLGGSEQVKSKGIVYLPMPNSDDQSPANLARYESYKARAVFYNFMKRTLEGMIGEVFSRDPIMALPEVMWPMIDDVDGAGVSLDQQAKLGLSRCLTGGGFGLLVDYPVTSGPLTLAQQREGNIRATILQYQRTNVINWRFIKRGAREIFSLIVIEELGKVKDDGFEVSYRQQWRVLQLDDAGQYVVTVYVKDEEKDDYVIAEEGVRPTGSDGKPLTEIPFYFCGILNNNSAPDAPPMYDLAELNLAHYRNSADYEDSCYMVGQPTPYFAGLTEQWVKKVFQNKTIRLGSREAIPLPVGGTAGLLQVSPNSMPFEAMNQKEKQAMALGAKLIEPGGGKNTLGEAQQDETTEASMLATAAKNVSLVYRLALRTAGVKMYGIDETKKEEIDYSLNTDFPGSRLTPNERTQLVLEWQSGAITETEMRAGLRKAGVATLDHEDYKEELKKNPPPQPKEATNNGDKGGGDNEKKQNKDEKNNGGNQNGV